MKSMTQNCVSKDLYSYPNANKGYFKLDIQRTKFGASCRDFGDIVFTYAFQSESSLCSCLTVKEVLAPSRCDI